MGEPIKRKPRRIDDQLRVEAPEDDKFEPKEDEGKKKALRSIISKRRASRMDGNYYLED